MSKRAEAGSLEWDNHGPVTFETVRMLALALPKAEEGTTFVRHPGVQGITVARTLFAHVAQAVPCD